jgi:hypothetical protein
VEFKITLEEFNSIKVMKSLNRIDFSLAAIKQLGHDIPSHIYRMRDKLEIMEKCDRNPNCQVIVINPDGSEVSAKYISETEEWVIETN